MEGEAILHAGSGIQEDDTEVYRARAIRQLSESESKATTSGALFWRESNTVWDPSEYFSSPLTAFQDINGDGYPDILMKKGPGGPKVYFTNARGGHGVEKSRT